LSNGVYKEKVRLWKKNQVFEKGIQKKMPFPQKKWI